MGYKPFVIWRKNFLFANTTKCTTASAKLYIIIETAKTNKLVVEKHLVYLFDNLLNIDSNNSKALKTLMPWQIIFLIIKKLNLRNRQIPIGLT